MSEEASTPPPIEPLPWHEEMLARLQREAREARLPQTLLLSAPVGTGLSHFADVLTGWLLCDQQSTQERACGVCRGCRQWLSGGHPDAIALHAQGAGQEITVDAVREAIETLNLARHYDGYRIARLEPAEALNRSAANALLKTLEEPSAGTIFLLLSGQPRSLPATVRSRAQIRQLPQPGDAQARDWLQAQGCEDIEAGLQQFPGQPLHALRGGDAGADPALYESAIEEFIKNPLQRTDNTKKVSETRESALAFANWLATRQWQLAQQATTADTADARARARSAVDGYRLALDARMAIKAYTPPQLVIESLFVSWRALRVQSQAGSARESR